MRIEQKTKIFHHKSFGNENNEKKSNELLRIEN